MRQLNESSNTPKLDTRRNCPSCFRLQQIPAPLPICRACIPGVPAKLQSALASAILGGDQKTILRVTGEVVTAAWEALAKKGAPVPVEQGAR